MQSLQLGETLNGRVVGFVCAALDCGHSGLGDTDEFSETLLGEQLAIAKAFEALRDVRTVFDASSH